MGDAVIGQEMIQLASGREVPSVGLGLWKIEQESTAQVVEDAIECGYRHFDSACDYGNEHSRIELQFMMVYYLYLLQCLFV